MNKQEFCEKVDEYIDDEEKAEKDYMALSFKIQPPLNLFQAQGVLHAALDERQHAKFWREIKENICSR